MERNVVVDSTLIEKTTKCEKSNTNCWLFGRGVDVIVFTSHIYRSDITLPQWEKIPFTMFMHFLSTAATPNRTKHIVGDMRLISKNIL